MAIALEPKNWSYLPYIYIHTWWRIPLSKWVITLVINGISRVNPLIIGVVLTKWDKPPRISIYQAFLPDNQRFSNFVSLGYEMINYYRSLLFKIMDDNQWVTLRPFSRMINYYVNVTNWDAYCYNNYIIVDKDQYASQ